MDSPLLLPLAKRIVAAILCMQQSTALAQSTCPNSDFSQGSFTDWQSYTGMYVAPAQVAGLVTGRHTVMTVPAIDPFTCGGLNVIPPGGTTSARLGNSNTGAEAEQLIYTVAVTPQTALFVYKYAVVLENPTGHLPSEQPEFSVRILDDNGDPVAGNCGAYSVYGGQPDQNFQECGAVTWLPWSTVGIDLTPFMGENIQIEFTTKDCLLTGHFGYAYISAMCAPMVIDQAYCAGDTAITLTAPPGFQDYTWTPGNYSGAQVTVPTPSQGTVFNCAMTTYSNQGNCLVNVDVQIAPTVVTAALQTMNGCENTLLSFADSSTVNTGNLTEWLWDFGDGSTSVAQFPNHTYTNAGAYLVRLIATSGDCRDTVATEIAVYDTPNTVFTTTGVCISDSVFMTNQSTDPYPLSYTWDTGDGSSAQQSTHLAHLYANAGTYTVTLQTVNSMGCNAQFSLPVTVFPPPFIDAGPDIQICPGTPVTLSANGAISYNWSGGITNATPFTPTGSTTYQVTGTDVNGCSSTDEVILTIYQLPVVEAGNFMAVCHGTPVTLNASGATTYNWTQSVTDGISFTPNPGTHLFTVTGTDLNGCSSEDTVSVRVFPLPEVTAGNNQLICAQSSVTLQAAGASSYTWDNGIQNGIPFSPVANTTYTVTGTDIHGCTDTAQVMISIEPPVPVLFDVDASSGCVPHTVHFSHQLSVANAELHWIFGDGEYDNGTDNVTHTYDSPGCFDVRLIATTPLGCVSDTILPEFVCAYANPVAGFQPTPDVLSELNAVTTMFNSTIGAVAYNWDFGDGSTSQQESPTHDFGPDIAEYTIVLTTISEHGCTDVAEATIDVREELLFYVPNTFTPDGDQYNEIFKPVFTSGFDKNTYHLWIYNRWGELVFESQDVEEGWNGMYAGTIAQDGTYTWKIEFKTTAGYLEKPLTGHVNLLR